ncbi:MAG TPA: DUF5689 domain-containing protein [Bacteroidia bacterium]|jgi:hypothetical protein|nr:DUF5689 domain-containing protein [Bacteroidia bacterium]
MKNNQYIHFISSVFIAGLVISSFSCKKHLSIPPASQVALGPVTTIDSLRNKYNGQNQKFISNTILRVVVTCDETSGNLYKQVYVRDYSGEFAITKHYGAIALRFTSGTKQFLSVGDSIAVNLNGATLTKSSGGSLEIDSIVAINQVIHLKTGLNPQPLVVTLPQLNSYSVTPSNPALKQFIYDAQLVQLNSVEFIQPNVGGTYAIYQAPPIIAAPKNVNKYLSDSAGNTMVTYNSGYANFATVTIPNNSGSVIGVANLYTTMQLTLRSDANGDINFNQPYRPIVYDTITQNFSCAALFTKTDVFTAGWITIPYKGGVVWQATQYGTPAFGNSTTNWKYAPSASNYKSTDVVNDMWLVSPPIKNPGGGLKKYMDFTTALQYGTITRCLSVLVSASFDGTHIIPSQWVDLSAAPFYPHIATSTSNGYPSFIYASNGSFTRPATLTGFVPPVTPTNNSTFYVAFRYQTNTNYADSTGMTYLLNNFILRNNP